MSSQIKKIIILYIKRKQNYKKGWTNVMEFNNYEKCDLKQLVSVDGFIQKGRQFDVEITVPEDNRNVIYGILKNQYNEPLKDAVVKLIEVLDDCGKKERRPVSHTFTDKNGEFVFGPLCPDRKYEIQIWYNAVNQVKICEDCSKVQECLKGSKLEGCSKDLMFPKSDCSFDCNEK